MKFAEHVLWDITFNIHLTFNIHITFKITGF